MVLSAPLSGVETRVFADVSQWVFPLGEMIWSLITQLISETFL